MSGAPRPGPEPPRPRLAPPLSPAGTALLLVGVVGGALLLNEALRRLSGAGRPAAPFDPADLSTLSAPDATELALFVGLALVRLLAARFVPRRVFLPLLDLPLLGLAVAVSGGTLSPLDPTLALVYLTALLFLRGSESGRAAPRRLAAELLVGLLGLHAIVLRHDRGRLASGLGEEALRVAHEIEAARTESDAALHSIDDGLATLPDAAAVAGSVVAAPDDAAPARTYAGLRDDLKGGQGAIARFLARLVPTAATGELADAKIDLEQELEKVQSSYFDRRSRWQPVPAEKTAFDAVASLDFLRETQWNVRQRLLARMDEIETALERRDRMEERQREFLTDATLRRVALAAALLLFAGVALALRDRLAAAVRESEERRARREVEASEQETERWIAVTAGLTHGLGNDIVAYDVWLREMERALAPLPDTPPRVRERLRALIDSNRGRLGFLRFLDSFARQRQAAAGDAPPLPAEPVELLPLLERVRRNLAQVEIADLPAEGSDPGVDRQIRKLRDLPLEVRAAEPAAEKLARSQRGLVEFIVYELLKNALRSATGTRPLVVHLARTGNGVELALENDVEVEESEGECPHCGRRAPLRRVRRRRDAAPACADCFGPRLQDQLDESFAPGKGGGTGLGLFLIRYFLSTFWSGRVHASVVDAARPVVRFAVELPETPHEGA